MRQSDAHFFESNLANEYGIDGEFYRDFPNHEWEEDESTWEYAPTLEFSEDLKQNIERNFDPMEEDGNQGVTMLRNLISFLENNTNNLH